MSFFVLCIATLAIVAVAVSATTGLALPGLDRAIHSLAPDRRASAWLAVAAAPWVLGVVTIAATLLPAIGLGADHCLEHDPHHPHICPHHAVGVPGAVVIGIAVLATGRFLYAAVASVRAAWLSGSTSRTLGEGSERRGDVRVFDSSEPQAFVLGVVSPTVYASRGLFALGDRIVEPVLAHERSHARTRDSLWRALVPLIGSLQLPVVGRRLARRLATAQEVAADAMAARHAGGPVIVAESLIALARMKTRPATGISFLHGDIETRVRALVGDRQTRRSWPTWALVGAFAGVVAAIGVLHEPVHHALETFLGILS